MPRPAISITGRIAQLQRETPVIRASGKAFSTRAETHVGVLSWKVVLRQRIFIMANYIGAIDQGTTSTRFIVFDNAGRIVSGWPVRKGPFSPAFSGWRTRWS